MLTFLPHTSKRLILYTIVERPVTQASVGAWPNRSSRPWTVRGLSANGREYNKNSPDHAGGPLRSNLIAGDNRDVLSARSASTAVRLELPILVDTLDGPVKLLS